MKKLLSILAAALFALCTSTVFAVSVPSVINTHFSSSSIVGTGAIAQPSLIFNFNAPSKPTYVEFTINGKQLGSAYLDTPNNWLINISISPMGMMVLSALNIIHTNQVNSFQYLACTDKSCAQTYPLYQDVTQAFVTSQYVVKPNAIAVFMN